MKLSIFQVVYLKGLLNNRLEELPNDSMAKELIEILNASFPSISHIVGTTTTLRRQKESQQCLTCELNTRKDSPCVNKNLRQFALTNTCKFKIKVKS